MFQLDPTTLKLSECSNIVNDIDSVLVVSKSLKAYDLVNHIGIRVRDKAVTPDFNKKMTSAQHDACDIRKDDDYCWKVFHFAGSERSSIYFLMYIHQKSKTKGLKASFMAQIVREAGKKCTGRLIFSNLGGFYEYDATKVLNIFREDWVQLAESMDEMLQTSSFLQDKQIKKYFFYCTYRTC